MRIKWILLVIISCLLLLPTAVVFGQNEYKSADDIWDDFNPTGYTDSTGWEEDDFIYLAAGDSIYVFPPILRSRGCMWFHGYITAIDTLFSADYSDYDGVRDTVAFNGTDSVYFGLAPNTGGGDGLNTNETETYTLFDSSFVTTTNGTAAFDFNPMSSSTFRTYSPRYWTLLIYNQSSSFCKIKLTIEWVMAYKKY